jgi:hypothetical protein
MRWQIANTSLPLIIAEMNDYEVVLFSMGILLSFLLLFGLFFVGWWFGNRPPSTSPYTGIPLREATTLSYYVKEKVARFLVDLHQYDNRIFLFKKSAFCRETGRIFQDCINWFGVIKVDWSFIRRRYPGHYVSWGSLNAEQKKEIREVHGSLEGFQTESSSPSPSPRAIEPDYVFIKPGPLYVDINTKVLLGWKVVPGTEVEVFIVQKPKNQGNGAK